MRKSTTPKGVASSLALLPRVGCVALANPALSKVQPRWGKGTPRGWRELSNVQCDEVMAYRVVWWSVVGAAPVCPPVSPSKGASVVQFPAHNTCVFGMETPLRGRSGGHTGAAPTVSFGRIACGTVDFVWADCAWAVLFVGKTVHMNQHYRCCTFVSPGLPTIGGYPG